MSAPPDIAAFLRARYDEREAKANGALPGPWVVEEHTYETVVTSDGGKVVASVDALAEGWHIADNDPAFVLADVAANRMILEKQEPDDSHGWHKGYRDAVEDILRLLALPFAGHPDYQEGWRP